VYGGLQYHCKETETGPEASQVPGRVPIPTGERDVTLGGGAVLKKQTIQTKDSDNMANEQNSVREKEKEKGIEIEATYTSNEACNPPKEPRGTSVHGKVIKINKKQEKVAKSPYNSPKEPSVSSVRDKEQK
jgi:hypothetical protein